MVVILTVGWQPCVSWGRLTSSVSTVLCLFDLTLFVQMSISQSFACERQMAFEGGFTGRTNKLVDSCYSFWQGALFPLIRETLGQLSEPLDGTDEGNEVVDYTIPYSDPERVKRYLLECCQFEGGGFVDRPSLKASPDHYHTCYAMSGLSLAESEESLFGSRRGVRALVSVDIYYNVTCEAVQRARQYFERIRLGTRLGEEGKGVKRFHERQQRRAIEGRRVVEISAEGAQRE
eukprot:GHVN01032504.1.p1 GENE.GHVN01032504.1~~GHVN01032504.1.p1  ORF type:complete len:233 (-),score=42.88 GHVN01032504.1:85-783(-)